MSFKLKERPIVANKVNFHVVHVIMCWSNHNGDEAIGFAFDQGMAERHATALAQQTVQDDVQGRWEEYINYDSSIHPTCPICKSSYENCSSQEDHESEWETKFGKVTWQNFYEISKNCMDFYINEVGHVPSTD